MTNSKVHNVQQVLVMFDIQGALIRKFNTHSVGCTIIAGLVKGERSKVSSIIEVTLCHFQLVDNLLVEREGGREGGGRERGREGGREGREGGREGGRERGRGGGGREGGREGRSS